MSIAELAMQNPDLRRAILVEFGFGHVSPKKVEKWLREKYTVQYAELKRNSKKSNVIQFETELTTSEHRTKILNNCLNIIDGK